MGRLGHSVRIVILVASGVLFLPSAARSQNLNGSVVGNVRDSSDAAVPDATVTLTSNATNQSREAVTDGQGGYDFATVQPGLYLVKVAKGGFATFEQINLTVTADNVSRVDATLKVGGVSETVQVEAQTVALQTDSAQVTKEMTSQQLQNLPVYAGRNYQNLLNTVPGITPVTSNSHSVGTNPSRAMFFRANGADSYQNDERIDGASTQNMHQRDNAALVPTLESIETVSIATNAFEGDSGFVGGASVRVQTKSGANDLHGAIFEGYTGNKLETTPFFLPAGQTLGKVVYHEFGAAAGWKIIRNKLFWFGSYEGDLDHEFDAVASGAGGSLLTVATPLQRAGNFSESTTPIYDPMTGNASGVGRTAFVNNQIPFSRQDPIALKLQALVPLPNVPGATITNNFNGIGPYYFNRHHGDGKLNWNPTSKLTLFARYSTISWLDMDASVFGCKDGVDPKSCIGGQDVNTQGGQPGHSFGSTSSVTVGATYVLRPNLILDGYFAWESDSTSVEPFQTGLNLGQELGIPGTNGPARYQSGWPLFTIGSSTTYAPLGNWFSQTGGSPYYRYGHQRQYIANLNWSKSKHDIRFGGEIDRQYSNNIQTSSQGSFTFSGGPTQLAGGPSANQFNSYATFLLGLVTSAADGLYFSNPPSQIGAQTWYNAYVRDRWNITPKLTASFGLRWDYYGFPNVGYRNASAYDLASNQAEICGMGNVPTNCGTSMPKHLFSPRLGLAYRLSSSLVIRAGYSLNYLPFALGNSLRGNYPTAITASYPAPNSFSYYGTLEQGITPVPIPTVGSSGYLPIPSTVTATILPNGTFPWPYAQSWNFTVQKEMKWGFVGQVGYVANRTIKAIGNDAGSTFNLNVDTQINTGNAGLPYNTAAYGNRTAAVNYFAGHGNVSYNGLQSTLNRRMRNGLQVGASWTWSKAEIPNYTVQPSVYQYLYLNTRIVEGSDRTHVLTLNAAYELPFGQGKPFLAGSKVANAVLSGWVLNGLGSFFTGLPFSISCSSTSLNMVGANQLCLQNKKDVAIYGNIGGAYFDPLAFSPVTTASFGYVQPNGLRGPGLADLDIALSRTFRFKERWHFEFRADAFNLTNTPHFSNPGGNVSNLVLNPDGTVKNLAGFAQVTSVANTGRDAGDQRDIRFSLRIGF